MWLLYTALMLALVVFVCLEARRNKAEQLEDERELRHTIAVNLGILKRELMELQEIAKVSNLAELPRAQANSLLAASEETADRVQSQYEQAGLEDLRLLITALFQAMNQATEARRTLGAIIPLI